MDKLIELFLASGAYNISGGQIVMILIGLLLLFLAIKKNFEPLLLVPIGFGGILANIPEAGLAYNAVENALHFAVPEVMNAMAAALNVSSTDPYELLNAYNNASAAEIQAAKNVAYDGGYANGMLYNFYSVAIGSTVAPL